MYKITTTTSFFCFSTRPHYSTRLGRKPGKLATVHNSLVRVRAPRLKPSKDWALRRHRRTAHDIGELALPPLRSREHLGVRSTVGKVEPGARVAEVVAPRNGVVRQSKGERVRLVRVRPQQCAHGRLCYRCLGRVAGKDAPSRVVVVRVRAVARGARALVELLLLLPPRQVVVPKLGAEELWGVLA